MSGTKEGGKLAAERNKERHGKDFYREIGRKGGSVSHPETRVFSMDRDKASKAGVKGGKKSRRYIIKENIQDKSWLDKLRSK